MVRIARLPGVFRPLSDTWLLAAAARRQPQLRGGRVLDLCTGSGAVAISAARAGARSVTAVDVSRRAVWTVRINAALNGVRVDARRGDLFRAVAGGRFDVICANPPYLPASADELPARGRDRHTEAGRTGRALLDRIIAEAPAHLAPGGVLLVIHSSVNGEATTLDRMRAAGLEPLVAERRRGPLGPLLAARAPMLEARGLLPPGEREEDLLVVAGAA
ncbi:MAG TPA: HemK2/MTQ2 family protein methyltransferase [Solirubrobacteraceae bacterium]|nr:HemK2/MTQ2 family protein methyltransferase [Solirubrobacteraceae bacterium]